MKELINADRFNYSYPRTIGVSRKDAKGNLL